MKTDYTQKPFEVTKMSLTACPFSVSTVEEYPKEIARVMGHNFETLKEVEANAKLLAASPLLLIALKEMLILTKDCFEESEIGRGIKERAIDALNKATE